MTSPSPKYWKQSDSTDVRDWHAIHEGDGTIRVRSFFDGLGTTGVRMHLWELAPGVSEGDHIHAGDDNYEETYYFLNGRGVMTIEGEEVEIQAGDAVLVPPGVDHGFRNTGDEPLRVVLLFGKPRS
ncbi:MAG: cupin domain-containing protein [Planctomycetota bacterium]|nr:cupin domain-containing protein [Planctomycetota bacterium]